MKPKAFPLSGVLLFALFLANCDNPFQQNSTKANGLRLTSWTSIDQCRPPFLCFAGKNYSIKFEGRRSFEMISSNFTDVVCLLVDGESKRCSNFSWNDTLSGSYTYSDGILHVTGMLRQYDNWGRFKNYDISEPIEYSLSAGGDTLTLHWRELPHEPGIEFPFGFNTMNFIKTQHFETFRTASGNW